MDIREHGSKNMGASNTFRVMGPAYGIVVLVIDMAKGFLAVQLASYLDVNGEWYTDQSLWQLLLGLMSVIGHVFPLFAGFRGGKGYISLGSLAIDAMI